MREAIDLTHTYPYEELNDYLRIYPDRRATVLRTLDFYDGINMAPRISCPTLMNIGLADPVCPPETGYAVFAAVGTAVKELRAYPGEGHGAGGAKHAPHVQAWMRQHLRITT